MCPHAHHDIRGHTRTHTNARTRRADLLTSARPAIISCVQCKTEMKEWLREAPTNNWATSQADLVPHTSPVRVLSIANEKHREVAAPRWAPDGGAGWKVIG